MNNEELLKNECIKRLKLIDLDNDIIKEFKENNVVYVSDFDTLRECEDMEKDLIREFEEEHTNSKVYHIIKTHSTFGIMYSIFYTDNNVDEWLYDIEDLIKYSALVYVKVIDNPYHSEFGMIEFSKYGKALIRCA